MTFSFYLLTFSNILSNRLSIFFSIPLKYYFFIPFLIFLNSSIFFKFQTTLTNFFFNEKCCVYNIFSQYFHNKILYGKLLLVLIWTHHLNYFFTHQYQLIIIVTKNLLWKKRCYVHNIFTTNHRWLVVIGSNLNLTLRLLFFPNNNNQ